MTNGSFDDGTIIGTREARSEWERSQLINSGRGVSPQSPSVAGYAQPVATPGGNLYQGQAYTGGASGRYDPLAGAYACFLLFGLLCLFDFYGKFGAPLTASAWGMQTGAEAGVLGLLFAIACLAPAAIGWPIALALLAADVAQALPHQAPWLFKAPLVLPSWWPVWAFELFMIALRVVCLSQGVRIIRASRLYRA